jgi:hypothetical protein
VGIEGGGIWNGVLEFTFQKQKYPLIMKQLRFEKGEFRRHYLYTLLLSQETVIPNHLL